MPTQCMSSERHINNTLLFVFRSWTLRLIFFVAWDTQGDIRERQWKTAEPTFITPSTIFRLPSSLFSINSARVFGHTLVSSCLIYLPIQSAEILGVFPVNNFNHRNTCGVNKSIDYQYITQRLSWWFVT